MLGAASRTPFVAVLLATALAVADGARVRIGLIEPRDAEPSRPGPRPVLLAIADSGCTVVAGRRLAYDDDGEAESTQAELLRRSGDAAEARQLVQGGDHGHVGVDLRPLAPDGAVLQPHRPHSHRA